MFDQPALKSKDAPDLARFDWTDPFRLDDQLTEEERMLRDAARAYADEVRAGTFPDRAHSFLE